jgi:hypothetical protein
LKTVSILIEIAKKRGVKSYTKFEKRFLADWIRDECALRKLPPSEVDVELERHGLK